MKTKSSDGCFDYQLSCGRWYLLILRWRPEAVYFQKMVKTSEGGWSHVSDFKIERVHRGVLLDGLFNLLQRGRGRS